MSEFIAFGGEMKNRGGKYLFNVVNIFISGQLKDDANNNTDNKRYL